VKSSSEGESDNDFIEAAEERTAVGINDNISAAAAMLSGNSGVDDDDDADVDRGIGTPMFMATGGGAKAANKYGRPYSNFELTNGCTPQFGCDDPSLPHESDLGVFETKEEEKRSAERRQEQNMIEEFASPGIMPHVACPTQCLDLDDSTSWNSRFDGCDLESNRNGGNTMLISLDGNSLADPNKVSTQQQKSLLYEVSRIAWWNLPDGYGISKDGIKARRTSRGATSSFCGRCIPRVGKSNTPGRANQSLATVESTPGEQHLWFPISHSHIQCKIFATFIRSSSERPSPSD